MRAHCPRCEDKDEELAYLRSELALVENIEAIRRLKNAAGLHGPTEARILWHFMNCRHNTATRLQLADVLRDAESDPKAVDVFLSRIRGRLGPDTFESIWGSGWKLTPAGIEKVNALLAQH